MSGLCPHCRDNAVAPAEDLCADCLNDVDTVVVQLRARPDRPCPSGRGWCFGPNSGQHSVCDDCADIEQGGEAA